MSNPTTSLSVWYLAPELSLVMLATAIYLFGAFVPARRIWNWIGIFGLVGAAVLVAQHQSELAEVAPLSILSGPGVIDGFTQATRWFVLGLGVLYLLMSTRSIPASVSAEYAASLVLVLAGLMLVSAAGDLVLLFVGLELVSIPTYVVLYLGRDDIRCQESAAKYFFLSILSSAVLLYGLTFLYGATGTTQLAGIERQLATVSGGAALFAKVAVVMIFAGLGFRLTVVPFQFYAPDVYQGTSNVNAGLLSVLPKIAGLAGMMRLIVATIPTATILQQTPITADAGVKLHEIGWRLAFGIAVVTMTFGNLIALRQSHIRRLMAYSSIAHAGYLFVGLAIGLAVANGAESQIGLDGIAAMLFYLVVYAVATTGAFAVLSYLDANDRPIDALDDLAGLGTVRPLAAIFMSLFMFSLIGVPPLAGFWGKFSLLVGALNVEAGEGSTLRWWFLTLAVVTVLNAAIAATYYLRVIGVMFFRPAMSSRQMDETRNAMGGRGGAPAALSAAMICAALTVALGIAPSYFVVHAQWAAEAPRATLTRVDAEEQVAAKTIEPSAEASTDSPAG